MTPRTEIVWLDLDDPPPEIRRKLTASAHSRFPLCQGTLDHVLGIVQAKDVLASSLAGEPIDWKGLAQRPLFVPESMRALKLLETFKQSGRHLALVMDEYGGTQGLVTPSDILEAIVGEMPVVGEPIEPEAVQREDGSWLIDGMMAADEFNELFHLPELPEEESGEYETLGGFVMTYLGRIPAAGDHFEWGGLRFEVLDMDGHRVDKVLVSPGVRHPEESSSRA
jgi:putative hemolysin